VEAYNSAKTIGLTLTSLKGKVERIVVADGYFSYAKHVFHEAGSIDGTEKEAWKHGAEWIPVPSQYADKGFPDEVSKQNFMLSLVEPGDWLFWLATDEQLIGGEDLAMYRDRLGSDAIPIRIHTVFHPSLKSEDWYACRFHRYLPGMRFVDQHYIITAPNLKVSLFMRTMPVETYIQHDKDGEP